MRVRELRELERVEWRVLAAVRPLDATSRVPVRAPLVVTADGADIRRNRRGLYVVARWDTLAAHEASFDAPPPAPPVGDEILTLSLRDAAGRYLPRSVRLALPRDPDPQAADSLFTAVDVPLYGSPTAGLSGNWTALRVHLAAGDNGDALGGALLRVVAGDAVLARGLTDWRGEALVPVAGVPVTTWANGDGGPPGGGPPGGGPPGGGPPGGGGGPPGDGDPVVVTSIPATLEAVFDPAAGTRTPAAEVAAGRAPRALPVVDPEDLEDRRAALPGASVAISLAARGAVNVNLDLALP